MSYSYNVAHEAADMLSEAWGTALGGPHELFGTMGLVQLPSIQAFGRTEGFQYPHAEAVQNALFKRNVEVPVKVLSGRLYVRISAHIYNELADYEVLRDAVLELASAVEV